MQRMQRSPRIRRSLEQPHGTANPGDERPGQSGIRKCSGRVASFTLVGVLALAATGCESIVERQIAKNFARAETGLLTSPDMTVILCGTGSPVADPDRASACTAVIAGGEVVLVDTGPGSWEVLDLANVPTGALSAVLLTHFHSDHIGDLGEAVTQSWIAGRKEPLDVYGPPGTRRVVEGFGEAYAADVVARVAHHGEEAMPAAGARAVPHEISLPADPEGAVTVFERNGLRVTAFRVDHRPVEPAVGYRFDYRGRSVVVSGDTIKTPSLIRNAAGADILVQEALNSDITERARRVAAENGRTRLAKLVGDIPGYHTTPVQAAEIARDAKVKHLVLSHLVPAPTNFLTRRVFVAGAADVFDGEITIGEDGDRFTLPPKS